MIPYPAMIERNYAAQMSAVVRAHLAIVADELLAVAPVARAMYSSAMQHDEDDLGGPFDEVGAEIPGYLRLIRDAMTRATSRLRGFGERVAQIARRFSNRADRHNREGFHRSVRAALAIDVTMIEQWRPTVLQAWEWENLRLITGMSDEVIARMQGEVVRAMQDGTPSRELARIVRERLDVGSSRAKLIAADQIGKLNGQLTEQRQREIGVTHYVWRSCGDARVRPLHRRYNGQRFEVGARFQDAPPGTAIRCRCVAQSVFPGIDQIRGSVVPAQYREAEVVEA